MYVRVSIIHDPRSSLKSSTVEVQHEDRVCCILGTFDRIVWGHHHQGMTKPNEAADWLKNLPGYRELIKQRVHEARKRQRMLDQTLLREELYGVMSDIVGEPTSFKTRDAGYKGDIDKLGRGIDGCG